MSIGDLFKAACRELGVPLEEGLRRTADWIRAHLDRYKSGFLHV